MRQPLHDVVWADPDLIGCKDHPDSAYWSHVLITVKLQLIFLERQLQSKFRGKPHLFRICKVTSLGVKTDSEMDDMEFLLPFTFSQLLAWGKCRDSNRTWSWRELTECHSTSLTSLLLFKGD